MYILKINNILCLILILITFNFGLYSSEPSRCLGPLSKLTLHELKNRALDGDRNAILEMARRYRKGDGVPKSDKEALRWSNKTPPKWWEWATKL